MPRGRPRKRAAQSTAAQLASKPKRLKKGTSPVRKGGDVDVNANPNVDVDGDKYENEDKHEDGDLKEGLGSQSQSQSSESPLRKAGDARETIKALQSFVESTEKEEELAMAFEKMVKDEEKRLLGILEEFDRQMKAEEEEFEKQFAELLVAALAPTGTTSTETAPFNITNNDGEPIQLDITADKHPLYLASQALLESTQAMQKDCKKYLKRTKKLKLPDPPTGVWEEDQKEARRIISAAKRATAVEIERLLADDRKKKQKNKKKSKKEVESQQPLILSDHVEGKGVEKGKGKAKKAFEDDVHLQQVLKMGRQAVEKEYGRSNKKVYGWGKVASRAEKAMRGLVKALPDEKD